MSKLRSRFSCINFSWISTIFIIHYAYDLYELIFSSTSLPYLIQRQHCVCVPGTWAKPKHVGLRLLKVTDWKYIRIIILQRRGIPSYIIYPKLKVKIVNSCIRSFNHLMKLISHSSHKSHEGKRGCETGEPYLVSNIILK